MLNHNLPAAPGCSGWGAARRCRIFAGVRPAPLDVANDAFCRGGYIEKRHPAALRGLAVLPKQCAGLAARRDAGRQRAAGRQRCVHRFYPAAVSCAARWRQRWAGRSSISAGLPLSALLCRAALRRCCGLFAEGLAALWRARLCLRPARFYWSARSGTPHWGRNGVLAALYCYFVCRRQSRFASRGLFVINILAVGIHPYFRP